MNAVGTKVQNRVTYLIEFAGGKSAKLNDIAVAAMKLLKSDGKITTGEKGNLFAELSKTHAKSSANAMGNNTIGAMRVLKMVVSNEKGEYVPNPQSLYFLKISGMLEPVINQKGRKPLSFWRIFDEKDTNHSARWPQSFRRQPAAQPQ